MIMPARSPHRCRFALLLAGAALLAACALRSRRPCRPHDVEDSNALIMTAEIALQRDDCGRAAADYTAAAQRLTDAQARPARRRSGARLRTVSRGRARGGALARS